MKIKTQITKQYKSAFVLPNVWLHWDGIFTISVGWLNWCIDIDIIKK
jgi:hypothetical protein